MGHLQGGADQPVNWLTVFHALRLECISQCCLQPLPSGIASSGLAMKVISLRQVWSRFLGQYVGRRDKVCCTPHPSTEYKSCDIHHVGWSSLMQR